MDKEKIEKLLYVEQIHTNHFREWAKVARDPLSKAIFTMAADKEENHIKWVKMLTKLVESDQRISPGAGINLSDLEFWIEDEEGEGDSYGAIARKVKHPAVKYVLRQIASDETSNAEMIKELVSVITRRT